MTTEERLTFVKAWYRRVKKLASKRKYNKTPKGRARNRKYEQSPKGRETNRKAVRKYQLANPELVSHRQLFRNNPREAMRRLVDILNGQFRFR